ncbi:hypothetical protein MMC11_004036 [Xylographa trunciseda]|nr:hypothetical protein [Xylographa trunciseda]
MSEVSTYAADSLLIVSVCILRCVLTPAQTLFCLKKNFPGGVEHLEEDDIKRIWRLARDSYPVFFDNMSLGDVDRDRDIVSAFILRKGLIERMDFHTINFLRKREPDEEALLETYLTIGMAAQTPRRSGDES